MSEPIEAIGCGDSSCVFGTGEGTRYGGQHTNGGCRCLDGPGERMHPERRRRLARWIRSLVRTVRTPEARSEAHLRWRGVEPDDVCKRCGGSGCRLYGSTSTYHGGPGGQRMTADVCNGCWGSGSASKPGVNLKVLMAEVERLRRRLCVELDCQERRGRAPNPDPTCPLHGEKR